MPPAPSEPVQGQARRDIEPADAGKRAEQGGGIGSHRIRMAHERDDLGTIEEREPPYRPAHQGFESLVIGWERA